MIKSSNYIALHHGSLVIQDLSASLDFYCRILGMQQNRFRPEMVFEGAWLDIGTQQIHLLKLPRTEFYPDSGPPEHAGRDRHLAIHVQDLDSIKSSLEYHEIAFTMSRSGRPALFCRDPGRQRPGVYPDISLSPAIPVHPPA